MTETNTNGPAAPATAEDVFKEHVKFWNAATGFMTRAAIGVVVALVLLWLFVA